MKRTISCALLLLALATAAPLLCLLPTAAPKSGIAPAASAAPAVSAPLPSPTATPAAAEAAALASTPILLWDEAQQTLLTVPAEEYLVGAAACEMPVNWPDDALRAQMVACHSYALFCAANASGANSGAWLTVNTAQCSGYATAEVLKSRWGEAYDEHRARLDALAAEMAQTLLLYEGAPAAACYHAVSCGHTEASEAVWEQALPYLCGVDSPWDSYSSDYEVTVQYAAQQFSDAVAAGLGVTPSGAPAGWVGARTLDDAGYVQAIELCGQNFAGTSVRRALGLRSACFSISYQEESGLLSVTTKGYGHGVGMSQYGACAMAQGGADWQKILAYYYPGTELSA